MGVTLPVGENHFIQIFQLNVQCIKKLNNSFKRLIKLMQLRISIWFLTFNFIFGQNQTWTVYYHQTGQQDIYSSHCSEIGSVEDLDTHALYYV